MGAALPLPLQPSHKCSPFYSVQSEPSNRTNLGRKFGDYYCFNMNVLTKLLGGGITGFSLCVTVSLIEGACGGGVDASTPPQTLLSPQMMDLLQCPKLAYSVVVAMLSTHRSSCTAKACLSKNQGNEKGHCLEPKAPPPPPAPLTASPTIIRCLLHYNHVCS